MTYSDQFPEFVLDVTIPEGWHDVSWRNETCPCWEVGERDGYTFRVWVDYADPEQREFPETKRFLLAPIFDGNILDDIIETDDWDELLMAVGEKVNGIN